MGFEQFIPLKNRLGESSVWFGLVCGPSLGRGGKELSLGGGGQLSKIFNIIQLLCEIKNLGVEILKNV